MFTFQQPALARLSSALRGPVTRIARCRYSVLSAKPEKPFDVLFFGRDEFSCTVLEQLYNARDVWEKIDLVTQPDVKVGRRGSTLSISPLKKLGQTLDLPVHTIPPDRQSFRTWQAPEHFATVPPPSNRLLVSASFGRILPNTLLNLFAPGRRLNVHPSLLPAYRGAAPIQHTIMDGRTETGVCVIEMMERKKGIDAGEIWGVQTTTIPGDIEFCELRDQLAALGGILLVSALRDMLSGKANSVPQALDPSAPRAPLITSDDALVDFSTMTATEIVRRYRAISHQKMLFTKLKTEKTVQLHEMTVYPVGDGAMYKGIPAPGMATYNPPTRSLIIRCADGTFLRVDKLKTENKNLVPAKDWWNGVRPEWRESDTGAGPVRFVH